MRGIHDFGTLKIQKAPSDKLGAFSGFGAIGTRRRQIILRNCLRPQPFAASCGEGELHKKRTERGCVVGSGIKTDQPKCDGMAPAFMGFFTLQHSGGKGAYAQEFTSVHGFRMSKSNDLGWAWKPDEQTLLASQSRRVRKKIKRKLSKIERLCRAHGDIFYRSKKWRQLRWMALAEYGRKCMKCDAVDVEIHVDHIKPRSKFPNLALTLENLQVLCRECNMVKSNKHNTDYREESIGRDIDNEVAIESRRYI